MQKASAGFSDHVLWQMRNCFVKIEQCAEAENKVRLAGLTNRGGRMSKSSAKRAIRQQPKVRQIRKLNESSSQKLDAVPLEVDAEVDAQVEVPVDAQVNVQAEKDMSIAAEQSQKQNEAPDGQDIDISAVETIASADQGIKEGRISMIFRSIR